MSDALELAHRFLRGQALTFALSDRLWRDLRAEDELGLAHMVLARMRDPGSGALIDHLPSDALTKHELCRQQAMWMSKDPELNVASRHDLALAVLGEEFDLEDLGLDAETLGVAAGVLKRRWADLGQLEDLQRAATLYERGARSPLGDDAYAHINAAFTQDLLANAGDESERRRVWADAMRTRIVEELEPSTDWWTAASRAEALIGLGQFDLARDEIAAATRSEPWQLESTARQMATLTHLRVERPLERADVGRFFEALLPGAAAGVRSVFVGKVGLALSGGGFRASFFHLGLLARLAELDVLRHVDVLSCVSGGSIVGACYWLELRKRLLDPTPMSHGDYVQIVKNVTGHFVEAVETDVRGHVQSSKLRIAWNMLKGDKGAMDSEKVAEHLESAFYRPLVSGDGSLYMDELTFTPADHDQVLTGSRTFSPGKHNWLRAHKVPVLVLNATTMNTGHAWQFTPTWMGESPWAIHEAADSISRLEWAYYAPQADWRVSLGRAVAASACVPMVFTPVSVAGAYDDVDVQLVDGGVYDNQGCVSLLALGCNVIIASDASGQMLLERSFTDNVLGTVSYLKRSFDTVTARVRLANYADLDARRRSSLLRGLMFVHMKEGLDADLIRLRFSQESYQVRRQTLSPSGVRKDFQAVIADLRTDLDVFTSTESQALMACGYQMAATRYTRDLAKELSELSTTPIEADWPFSEMLAEITSVEEGTPRRGPLLEELRAGHKTSI